MQQGSFTSGYLFFLVTNSTIMFLYYQDISLFTQHQMPVAYQIHYFSSDKLNIE